jgi:ubiquinone/menaquinone biosynthesis C-methylase UbiE
MIYCYHVLEHITDYQNALIEMCRVLEPGGILFIGFPNKNRLFSYFGTSQKAKIAEKIKWNLTDYWMRLKGKFENKYGAHAGFTQKEFFQTSSTIFKSVIPKRNEYMLIKYTRHKDIIQSLINLKLSEILFPSNYFICQK